MKAQFKIPLIIFSICLGCSILQIWGGLICFLMTPVLLIIALVKFSKKETNEGQGYLLGIGISLLMGFSLCSYFPFHL